jgi:hypothetical protein
VVSLDQAARAALALAGTTEGERHGHRSWDVDGKVFAWERPFSKADLKRFGEATPPADPILAVRLGDLSEKEAVLAGGHPGFFTIPHFDGYAAVLIALRAARIADVRSVLLDGWLVVAPVNPVDAPGGRSFPGRRGRSR